MSGEGCWARAGPCEFVFSWPALLYVLNSHNWKHSFCCHMVPGGLFEMPVWSSLELRASL